MSSIDVMVTCFNYAHYLRQCADSVLAQSHRDLRVILVDDASTDETPAVSADLARQDQRVEILRHTKNLGHIATYNECIDLARSDYLLVLSADDFLLPGALQRAVKVLDARPDAGLCVGDHIILQDNDTLQPPPVALREPELLNPEWFIERLSWYNSISTATAVVRTSVQKRLGGYRLHLPHSGDLEMWLRFALHSQVAYVHAPQAVYRRHNTNMSLGYPAIRDLLQCMGAFRPHYRAISHLQPGGVMLAARIHWNYAARARAFARSLWAEGKIVDACGLHAVAIRENLAADMLLHRGRLAARRQMLSGT